jgi:hypothetical protein
LENRWQEAIFVFVDAEISLPYHPNDIVSEKRPSTLESEPAQAGGPADGYGWLQPDGVRHELEKMGADWKGPNRFLAHEGVGYPPM